MTADAAIAEAQKLAAQLAASGAPVTLQGEPHTAKRIMFYHGATTGHAACSCPVVDEQGHNVNPGRQPLDGRAAGRAEGARKASDTYARRRARKAADELAVIDPQLWDDATRRIVATLATISTPSPIDTALADAFPATTPAPYPNPRPRPDPDPRPRPEPHPRPRPEACGCPPHPIFEHVDACPRRAVHDNGDYRA